MQQESSNPPIKIQNGHSCGKDLVTTNGKTHESLAHNASKRLWYREELKQQMLSPKRAKLDRIDFFQETKF